MCRGPLPQTHQHLHHPQSRGPGLKTPRWPDCGTVMKLKDRSRHRFFIFAFRKAKNHERQSFENCLRFPQVPPACLWHDSTSTAVLSNNQVDHTLTSRRQPFSAGPIPRKPLHPAILKAKTLKAKIIGFLTMPTWPMNRMKFESWPRAVPWTDISVFSVPGYGIGREPLGNRIFWALSKA